jgi:S-adenosylmethionine-diacylglycerol 3-amino-3-carboxypropyl transferase
MLPPYLRFENFSILNKRIDRVQIRPESLEQLLLGKPNSFTHFVLLDHLDWLCDERQLTKVWRLLLNSAQPGAKILFRSASPHRTSVVPNFVYDHVHFDDERTKKAHQKDRVGTYMSTHLAEVL